MRWFNTLCHARNHTKFFLFVYSQSRRQLEIKHKPHENLFPSPGWVEASFQGFLLQDPPLCKCCPTSADYCLQNPKHKPHYLSQCLCDAPLSSALCVKSIPRVWRTNTLAGIVVTPCRALWCSPKPSVWFLVPTHKLNLHLTFFSFCPLFIEAVIFSPPPYGTNVWPQQQLSLCFQKDLWVALGHQNRTTFLPRKLLAYSPVFGHSMCFSVEVKLMNL